jgi:membrane protease YdiL (CAAX protease family)
MNTKRLVSFFLLSYFISWLIWLPLYLPFFGITGLPVVPYHHALGALGPILAGIFFTYKSSGPTGILDLINSMFNPSGKIPCILVALFSPFLLLVIAILLNASLNYVAINFKGIGHSKEFPEFGLAAFFIYNVVYFGYGEETGWRGYALQELQKKYNPLVSSIFLTLGWAIWHLPLFFYRSGYVSMDIAGVTGWFFSLLTGSILLTWMFNRSKSILVCALFHATIDIVFTSDISEPGVISVAGALITLWGVVTLLVFRKDFFYRNLGS